MMLPNGFKFGFSESGFQFEMGISEPDTNSDWYAWCHNKRNQELNYVSEDMPENGVAYWDLYSEDHDRASSIGMDSARIGLEWSRIFPKETFGIKAEVEKENGRIVSINVPDRSLEQLDALADQTAVQHYRDIFSDWKSRGKFLVINLYHWTIPLWLNDPDNIPDEQEVRALENSFDEKRMIEFVKYASYMVWKYDDLADMWCTMNEPNMIFLHNSVDKSRKATNQRKKYFAESHARTYEAMKKITKKPVGIIYANGDLQPFSEKDEGAARQARNDIRFSFFDYIINGDVGWYNNGNDYQEDIIDDMVGKNDWIGVNYYSRDLVKTTDNGWDIVQGYGHATGDRQKSLDGRSVSETGWEVYPEGIYNVVMEYNERYSIPMMVTENGMADSTDSLRPRYLVSHFNYLDKAIKDGANLMGYFHWALTDNFEWGSGFSKRFGLYGVDLRTKKRQLRPSSLVFSKIAEKHGVPDELMWMTEQKI